ncbi:hypothetical protein BJY52DRAFT_1119477, partial [Lactarius psammicola]
CDKYVFIAHRDDAYQIGGLFFDDLCDALHEGVPDAILLDGLSRVAPSSHRIFPSGQCCRKLLR